MGNMGATESGTYSGPGHLVVGPIVENSNDVGVEGVMIVLGLACKYPLVFLQSVRC
jgi:hypothetical protein